MTLRERAGSVSDGVPRRRILFILASVGGGGAERVVLTILRHLDRKRFEPHLALVRASGRYLGDLPGDVTVHDLKAGRARYAIPAIVRLAWRLRPHAVLSTLGYLNLVVIFAKPVLPRGTGLLVREGTVVSALLVKDVQYPKIWKWLYRRYYKKVDKIICQSDYMLNDLAENFGVPREKMVRIYNPVDVERIRRLAEADENPYPGAGPHLVSAGRLSNEKGFDLLLDAMPLVLERFPRAELTILGEGPLKVALEAQRERLGLTKAVVFVGFQPNPYPYFKHAHLFVLASRFEGLPNVLLEALALGTLVVATDCPGGVKELVNYADGMKLVPMDSPALLAEYLIRTLDEMKHYRYKQSNPHFSETFGVQNAVAEYEALLERVSDASSF